MLALYSITSLISALLLFLVQPMFAKMTLPLLGGTPAIWNTAMVFYQIVLLLGYAYSHFSTRWLGVKVQSILHIGLLIAAAVVLPISANLALAPDAGLHPTMWLLALYSISIGLPFFALSAMSPLLQRWFSFTTHKQAENPYFLYAASNTGSLLALLAYPVFIEPRLGLVLQGIAWTYLYGFFVLLVSGCVFLLYKNLRPSLVIHNAISNIGWTRRLKWVALAFVPSSLLLSVTSHMTTDLASAPFLWIMPLSIFLLTFVIVFSKCPVIKHDWMVKSQTVVMLLFAFFFEFVFPDFRVNVFIHLLVFFICAMVCHGHLAASKPDSAHLTEFYLFMSIGGALGGIFTAIIAPLIFSSVYEYPIGLVLACLARPVKVKSEKPLLQHDILIPLAIGAGFFLLFWFGLTADLPHKFNYMLPAASYITFAFIVFSFRGRPLRYSIGIAVILLFGSTLGNHLLPKLDSQRSFFAVHKIYGDQNGRYVFLKHGTTVHGIQSTDPSLWDQPLSYYHNNGPAGQFFNALKSSTEFNRVGLVGLGLGALTCYKLPEQQWTIFEIDPIVVEIAKNNQHFHYLEKCGPEIPIVIGDARLSLKEERDGEYDVLVLDAFSSDAIPIHLLTQEALDLYMSKLSERGILLMHISNRFLDLAPVVAKHAQNRHYFSRAQLHPGNPDDLSEEAKSYWVVLSQNEQSIIEHAGNPNWTPLPQQEKIKLWTDDFSNLWQVIIWPEK